MVPSFKVRLVVRDHVWRGGGLVSSTWTLLGRSVLEDELGESCVANLNEIAQVSAHQSDGASFIFLFHTAQSHFSIHCADKVIVRAIRSHGFEATMSGKDKAISHELEEGQEGSLDHSQKPSVQRYTYPTASLALGEGPSDERRYTLTRHTEKESSGGRERASEVLAETGMCHRYHQSR